MIKNILSPSILAANFWDLGHDIKTALDAGAEYLHIDVMDGFFVSNISFGLPLIASVREYANCIFDVHLMIEKPERYIEQFADCGADILTIHEEAAESLPETIRQIKACGIKAGVAINPATPIDSLDSVLTDLDMILIMTVNPGKGGQKFIPEMYEKIRQLRNRLESCNLGTDIEADGGINLDNLEDVLNAGANVCVAGSAVFHSDVRYNVQRFGEIMQKNMTKRNRYQ